MAIGLNERPNTCIDMMSQNLRGLREGEKKEIIFRMILPISLLLLKTKNLSLPTLTPGMSEL